LDLLFQRASLGQTALPLIFETIALISMMAGAPPLSVPRSVPDPKP
jgi:hypothetical protein